MPSGAGPGWVDPPVVAEASRNRGVDCPETVCTLPASPPLALAAEIPMSQVMAVGAGDDRELS